MGRNSVSLRGLAAVAVVCALACLGATSASAAPLLWTLNFEKNSVSTIDTATNQAVGTPIPTGEKPISIAITPNGKRAFVANFAGDSVTVIETVTRKPIATIPLPANAERIAISPDGKTAYVTVESNEHVFPIDTEANTLGTPIAVGPEASAVAFSPDGEQAYIGIAPNAVQVIETATGKAVGKPIQVGGFPTAIVFTPNGETAYVAAGNEVAVIDAGSGQRTLGIPSAAKVSGIAMDPHGQRFFVSKAAAGTVTAYETWSNAASAPPVTVSGEPKEIAITPGSRTAYVAVTGSEVVTPLDLSTNIPKAGTPIDMVGSGVGRLVVAPDQSPIAAFTPPSMTVGYASIFEGSASTEPGGRILLWTWSFGEGGIGTGPIAAHSYNVAGTHNVTFSVVDNEGCGAAEVFTGRTAYCSGGASTVTHPVVVKQPLAMPVCSSRFTIGGVSHNRKNGTVRLRLRFPSTGSFLLFGKKIHAVTRKVRKPGTTVVTLHARVELNKQLKKTLRASVRYRITFTPSAGCGSKTAHRSVALLRAPRKRHHR
jgi:YVTN family beta-propeller protein